MCFLLLILGFIILVKSADYFVEGCTKLAKFFKIPTLIIGLTIVSIGTTTPEAAVSITSAIKGMNSIALGNVVGSYICNILLILGLSGIIRKIKTNNKTLSRDFLYCILAALILFLVSLIQILKGNTTILITRFTGVILVSFYVFYMCILIKEVIKIVTKEEVKTRFNIVTILLILFGIIGVIIGGQLVVNSAVSIANLFNVSERVISLTIVAIGTSLPELVTSVVAAKKGETDMAIGNVVGANIINIFLVLGLSSIISPGTYGIETFIDITVMLFSGLIVYLFLLKDHGIGRKRGTSLLLIYILYVIYLLIR